MTTPAYEPSGVPKARTPEELAEKYRVQLVETARRSIAMRRHLPGCVVRWRRATPTGPNSEVALVFILRPGEEPRTEIWPYARIEELAAQVTNEDVLAELVRWGGSTPE